MDEIGADTFCERCGTRYTFDSNAPQTRLEKARFFARGFRHFVMNDGSSIDEAVQAARIEGGETVRAAEEFHKTFNFCMVCRQYACEKCWNENQNACLSCAPLWDQPAVAPQDRLLSRTPVAHPGHPGRAGKAARSRAGIEWPAEDVEVAKSRAEEMIPPPARPVPTTAVSAQPAIKEAPPFPFENDPFAVAPPPDIPPAPAKPRPPARPAPSEPRTPSWVAQQEQAVVDDLREKSQTWMSHDDGWSLWPADEAAGPRPTSPPHRAAPRAPDQSARAGRQDRSERQPRVEPPSQPEPTPARERFAAEIPTAPDEPDELIGRARGRQPEVRARAVEPEGEDLMPPPAHQRSRGGHARSAPAAESGGEDVGFDLIGSLRRPPEPAGATEPSTSTAKSATPPAAREHRGPVVDRILGARHAFADDAEGAPAKPASAPKPAPHKRAKDHEAAEQTPWPTPTRWADRPVAGDSPPEQRPAARLEPTGSQQTPVPPFSAELPARPSPAVPPSSAIPPTPEVTPVTRIGAPGPAARDAGTGSGLRMPPATTERWPTARRDIAPPPAPRHREWPVADAAVERSSSPSRPVWPKPRTSPTPTPSGDAQWPPVTNPWPPLETEGETPAPTASLASRHAAEDGESPLVAELWAESAQQVLDLGSARVCHGCGLPLSTHARFCRRCGSAQD